MIEWGMRLFGSKKATTLISVIIPAYNVEGYLRESLDGVVGQTYTNLEILCVDDGSTDATPEILAEYAEKDERIRIIRQGNNGVAKARNLGLERATGEYISFLDADDVFEPSLYEDMLTHAAKTEADICVCQSDSFVDDFANRTFNEFAFRAELIPKKKTFPLSDIPKHAFNAFNGYVWDKLFRAGFISGRNLRFHATKASSDARFVFLALATAKRIATVPKILIHRRSNRAGALTFDRDYQSFYQSYIGLRNDLAEAGLFKRYEQPYIDRVLRSGIWYLIGFDGTVNKEFYALLKDAWLEDLGLLGKDESWFRSADDYRRLCQIKQLTYEEFVDARKERR